MSEETERRAYEVYPSSSYNCRELVRTREGYVCADTGEVVDAVYEHQTTTAEPLDYRRPKSLTDKRLAGIDRRVLLKAAAALRDAGLQRRKQALLAAYCVLNGWGLNEYKDLCRKMNITYNPKKFAEVAEKLRTVTERETGRELWVTEGVERWVERAFGGWEEALTFDVMTAILGNRHEAVEFLAEAVVQYAADRASEEYGLDVEVDEEEARRLAREIADELPDVFDELARSLYSDPVSAVRQALYCRETHEGTVCRIRAERYTTMFWDILTEAVLALLDRHRDDIDWLIALSA